MCGCIWVDWLKPGRAIFRILCIISVILQAIVAGVLFYVLLGKGNDVTLALLIIFFIILICLSLCLIFILYKENLFYLNVYIVIYVIVGLSIILYLVIVIIHYIKYLNTNSFLFHSLIVLFTAKFIYKLIVLNLYAASLRKQI